MALSYLFDPNNQFQNRNGENNVLGHLEVFIDYTDDHAPTYCNFNGTLNPEKIVLDNNGRAVVIVDELKTYRIEVYDRSGNLLWSQYPVRPTNVSYGDNNIFNYNADIYGTEGEIAVTSSTDPVTGIKKFIVGLDSSFSGQVQQNTEDIEAETSARAEADANLKDYVDSNVLRIAPPESAGDGEVIFYRGQLLQ